MPLARCPEATRFFFSRGCFISGFCTGASTAAVVRARAAALRAAGDGLGCTLVRIKMRSTFRVVFLKTKN